MKLHESNTCCHDEVKVFKLEQDQNKVSATDSAPVFTTELATEPSHFLNAPFESELRLVSAIINPPPLLSEQDTYLQINVFRI